MARRRAPRPISNAIGELIDQAEPKTAIARVQSAWPEAVGETIARWAVPISERSGTVTFACTDSMVAHELEMMKSELLKKLEKTLENGAPSELKFVIR